VKGFRVFEFKGGSTDMADGVSFDEPIYFDAKILSPSQHNLSERMINRKHTSGGCESGTAPNNWSLLVAFCPAIR
jgi:hypothetical protein